MSGAPEQLPTYTWEPTTDFLAAKYKLPRESIVRFDVNTSPLPPDWRDGKTMGEVFAKYGRW